jgi:Tol biopolymer transport system component
MALIVIVGVSVLVLGAALALVAARPAHPDRDSRGWYSSVGRIAYADGADIAIFDPMSGASQPITSGGELRGVPVWSPDGTTLAFLSRPEDARSVSLVVMDVATGAREVLATGIQPRSQLAWSPDAGSLLFSELLEHTLIAVEIVSVETGQLTRLAYQGEAPVWLPDGRIVATDGASGALWILGMDGSEPVVISEKGSGDMPARPSPDGSMVAVVVWPDTRDDSEDLLTDISIVQTDGQGERPISRDPATEGNPAWSPDGSLLSWQRATSDSAMASTILVVAAIDGSRETMLEEVLSREFEPAWSPDGKAIIARAETGSMMLLDPTGAHPPATLPFQTRASQVSWQPKPPEA